MAALQPAWRGRWLRGMRAAAACGAMALLAACATLRVPTGEPGCARAYSGRLSVVEQGPQPRNLYASFELRLDGDSGWLEIGSPLGQMLARARWDADSARVDDGRQQRIYPSFEDMTQASVGLRLPRAALQDWVRGRAAAGVPWKALPGGGFEQLGWQVRPQRRGGVLHILRLRRDGPDDVEQLSLVIDHRQWIGSGCVADGPP